MAAILSSEMLYKLFILSGQIFSLGEVEKMPGSNLTILFLVYIISGFDGDREHSHNLIPARAYSP